eukprot:SAG31_NODE_3819_length_3852_cov_8.593658_3_plen_104_part_00
MAGKDKTWEAMTEDEQEAAEFLGWDCPSWDSGFAQPMDGKWWNTMGEDNRSAARRLGHTRATWDHGISEVLVCTFCCMINSYISTLAIYWNVDGCKSRKKRPQ